MNNKERFDLKGKSLLHAVPTSKSGIFTTGASSNTTYLDDMSKSCIHHVPGSAHKTDLSGNLNMVAVFQTIQIERLSVEIESLRISLKDREIQINNYRSYEIQISQLAEECKNLQNQRNHYQNQLQKMSLACTALCDEKDKMSQSHDHQVQLLSRKFYNAEEIYQGQIGDLKATIEQLEDALHDKERYEKESQNKSRIMQQELVKLNENIGQDREELDTLRAERDHINQELEKCMLELRKEQQSMRDHMARSRENEENLKQIYQQNKEYERLLDNLNRENTKLKGDLHDEEYKVQSIRKEGQSNQDKVEEYRGRIEQSNKELDNCKQVISEERKINDILKNDLNHIEKAYEDIKDQLNSREDKIMELIRGNEALANQLSNERVRCEDIAQYALELNSRIDQGMNEIARCKQALMAYNQQFEELSLKKKGLEDQLEMLQPVIKMKNDLQNEVHDLKQKIAQKEEELTGKESYIQDITIENKELTNLSENIQNNLNMMNENLRDLENTINQERLEFQKARKDEQEEKNNLIQELQKLKEEGLIHEQTKNDLRSLKETCEMQAQEILNQQARLQVIPKIIAKLKELNQEHLEAEKANENMREHLIKSVTMNENLIEQIGTLLQQISKLHEEIWALEEQLLCEKDRTDSSYVQIREKKPVFNEIMPESHPFSSPSVLNHKYSKDFNTTDAKKDPSPTIIKSSITDYNTADSNTYKTTRFSQDINRLLTREIPRPSSKDRLSPYRKLPPQVSGITNSEATFMSTSEKYGEGLNDSRKPFLPNEGSKIKNIKTNLTGGLSSMGREGVFKSTLLGEGPLVESKRYLEPSFPSNPSFYPPPPENGRKFNANEIGQKQPTKRSPSYEQFMKERLGK